MALDPDSRHTYFRSHISRHTIPLLSSQVMFHLPLPALMCEIILLGGALKTAGLASRRHALGVLAELLLGLGFRKRV